MKGFPKIGKQIDQKFNPYGLHSIHIPLALIKYDGATETRKSLSWGAKVFYGRLALFLGRPKPEAFCRPDLATMAATMGTSQDTIGRWLAELVDHGFIERIRKGRGPAECVFLPHRCLSPDLAPVHDCDSASSRNQGNPSNSADSRNGDETSTPQSCLADSATLPVQLRNSAVPTPQVCGFQYKEENIHENVQENVNLQHHRRDPLNHDGIGNTDDDDIDAAVQSHSSKTNPLLAFVRLVEAASGWQLSPADIAFCDELQRTGLSAETVCAGVYLGRARKLVSDDQHRIRGNAPLASVRSLRYFTGCIAEVAGGRLPAGYLDHVRMWLSRRDSNVSNGTTG
jgi:hypothetical protein